MAHEFTEHAKRALDRRRIRNEWVETALASPERTEPDKVDAALEHRLVRIPDYGDRVLRVIVNLSVDPQRVVTAFFDRTMRGKL